MDIRLWSAGERQYILYAENHALIKEALSIVKKKSTDVASYEKNGRAVAWQLEFDVKYLMQIKKLIDKHKEEV